MQTVTDTLENAAFVARWSPLLRYRARVLLTGELRALYDPEDLVADVWVAALPKLGALRIENESRTAVLVRFLLSTLYNRWRTLVQKHVRGKPRRDVETIERLLDGLSERACDGQHALAEHRAASRELMSVLADQLFRLSPQAREVLLLKGLEDRPNEEIGRMLGIPPNTVAVRYRRTLETLRKCLGTSVQNQPPPVDEQAPAVSPPQPPRRARTRSLPVRILEEGETIALGVTEVRDATVAGLGAGRPIEFDASVFEGMARRVEPSHSEQKGRASKPAARGSGPGQLQANHEVGDRTRQVAKTRIPVLDPNAKPKMFAVPADGTVEILHAKHADHRAVEPDGEPIGSRSG